jgi:type IX secretion system PorP/SprF family membrane protein
MKKRYSILFTVIIFTNTFKAQQESMYTHYMYNTLWLNPAYAGTRDALTVTGIHRSQWVAFDGAPLDQTLTMHMPVFNGKAGAGLSLLNDKIGPTKSTIVSLDYAYHLKLNTKSKISFGLKGLLNVYNNNINTLSLDNQADAAFSDNTQSIRPNVGTGIYYYRERFFAGISSPKLLENKNISNSLGVLSVAQRHYYFIMGSVADIGKTVKFKQTLFIKATASAPLQGDFTGTFVFNDKLYLGAMYRTGDALGFLLGYNISNQFNIGYSFDWSITNTTGRYNLGSHEIMLRYDFIYKDAAKIRSPRYF